MVMFLCLTSAMTDHHLLLAWLLPAKRISRRHARSAEGMVIRSIALFAVLFVLKSPHYVLGFRYAVRSSQWLCHSVSDQK